MTWNCPSCEHPNIWWRDVCDRCNVPTRGFDPKPQPEDPLLAAMREAIKTIQLQPLQAPALPLYVDCGCPRYGTCMSTACPRAMRVSY